MSLGRLLLDDPTRSLADASGRIYGVAVGVVTDNKDPDGLGRVKVKLPWLADDAESNWARLVTPMAGKERGLVTFPEVDDEVLVAYQHGHPDYAYVLGGLWNGKDTPPETNADGENNKRMLVSRSGLRILLDDKSGAEKIEIADKDGKRTIVIDVANKKVAITSDGDIELAAADGSVAIIAKTVKIESSGALDVKASDTLNVEGKTVNVKGQPTVNLN